MFNIFEIFRRKPEIAGGLRGRTQALMLESLDKRKECFSSELANLAAAEIIINQYDPIWLLTRSDSELYAEIQCQKARQNELARRGLDGSREVYINMGREHVTKTMGVGALTTTDIAAGAMVTYYTQNVPKQTFFKRMQMQTCIRFDADEPGFIKKGSCVDIIKRFRNEIANGEISVTHPTR